MLIQPSDVLKLPPYLSVTLKPNDIFLVTRISYIIRHLSWHPVRK